MSGARRGKFDYLPSFDRRWEGSAGCLKWAKRNAWIPLTILLGALVLCAAVGLALFTTLFCTVENTR